MPVNGHASTWVVLPVKRFARAKSRLSGSVPPAPRRDLARQLFERAVAAARECPRIDGILVATDGDDVARRARTAGLDVLRDPPGAPPLARIIDGALDALRARHVARAIVLMADLPEVSARALDEITRELGPERLVLVPDAARRGTNALGLVLDEHTAALRTCFGNPDSLQRHVTRAAEHGLRARVLIQPKVSFDVDLPDHLARVTL